MPPPPASSPLTLKVVSESRVTWATSVPISVFLGLAVLDFDVWLSRTSGLTDRRQACIIAPYPRGGNITMHDSSSVRVYSLPVSLDQSSQITVFAVTVFTARR